MLEMSLPKPKKQKYEDIKLLMWMNHQEDTKLKINRLVPITPRLRILHRIQ